MTIKDEVTQVATEQLRKYSQQRRIPQSVLTDIGNDLRSALIDSMSKGISPIDRGGRFPGYKNPTRYPDQVRNLFPNKRRRPVNLRLSGDFWKALKFRIRGDGRFQFGNPRGPSIEIGFYDGANALKEKGHREGANGQLERPVIPTGSQNFSRNIIQKVADRMISFLNT